MLNGAVNAHNACFAHIFARNRNEDDHSSTRFLMWAERSGGQPAFGNLQERHVVLMGIGDRFRRHLFTVKQAAGQRSEQSPSMCHDFRSLGQHDAIWIDDRPQDGDLTVNQNLDCCLTSRGEEFREELV